MPFPLLLPLINFDDAGPERFVAPHTIFLLYPFFVLGRIQILNNCEGSDRYERRIVQTD